MATEKSAIKRYEDKGFALFQAIEQVIADEKAERVDRQRAVNGA
jgi:hypothetical protein